MIVVVGLPAYADAVAGGGGAPDTVAAGAAGLAVEVAAGAVERGARVELIGKIGDDGAGDALVVALGRAGIGHAALLRDAGRPTPLVLPREPVEGDEEVPPAVVPADPEARPALDGADVELALRYLADVRVVVLAGPLSDAATTAAADGASFCGARLVVLVPAGGVAADVPPGTTVLETPVEDDGSFGRLVGRFAAALDAGDDAAVAFRDAVARSGWEAVAD